MAWGGAGQGCTYRATLGCQPGWCRPGVCSRSRCFASASCDLPCTCAESGADAPPSLPTFSLRVKLC
eukprot:2990495-Rhodomonas_salina.1